MTEQGAAAVSKSLVTVSFRIPREALPHNVTSEQTKMSKRRDESFMGVIASCVIKEITGNKQQEGRLKGAGIRSHTVAESRPLEKDVFAFPLSDMRLHEGDLSGGYGHFGVYSRAILTT